MNGTDFKPRKCSDTKLVSSCKRWTDVQLHSIYTGCTRPYPPLFRRTFLWLIHIYIIRHTYYVHRSWRVTEIINRQMWSSSCSTYCSCVTWCIFRTLSRSVLESIAKPSQAKPYAGQFTLCKVRGAVSNNLMGTRFHTLNIVLISLKC
jgi:hypothetical protein